jgi:hypothetical protein
VRLFFAVLVAATIIGGFVGGESTDRAFTLTGAVVGGVGTAAVLLGLGAYFTAQEEKKKYKLHPPLTPEIRAVFDRMIARGTTPAANPPQKPHQSKQPAAAPQPKRPAPADPGLPDFGDLDATMAYLMAEDAAAIARGETPRRRLIPHHAIKRDVIIAAYTQDFEVAKTQLQGVAWTDVAKRERLAEMTKGFDQHIAGVYRFGPEDLDKLIALMKRTRTDLAAVEQAVRAKSPIYEVVDPL